MHKKFLVLRSDIHSPPDIGIWKAENSRQYRAGQVVELNTETVAIDKLLAMGLIETYGGPAKDGEWDNSKSLPEEVVHAEEVQEEEAPEAAEEAEGQSEATA